MRSSASSATVLEAQDVEVSSVTYTTLDEPERGTRAGSPAGHQEPRSSGWLLAAAVALVLGFGLALTLDRSDTRVRTRRSAEERFGLPVIAEVVKFPFWSRQRRLAVVRQPDTAVAESYRTMRSALMLLARPECAAAREEAAELAAPTNGEARPIRRRAPEPR